MFTSACSRWAALTAAVALTGCEIEAPEFRFGIPLAGLEFELYSSEAGIHPNDDVLGDPNNPFRDVGYPALATRFEIRDAVGPVASFYAWASALTVEATGENQYYAAEALEAIYQAELVAEEQLPTVRQMAIDAYQSQLDNFPDALSFQDPPRLLPDGTPDLVNPGNERSFFRLATLSYQAIVRLGERVQGDWVLLVDAEGNPVAVRGSNTVDPPRPIDAVEEGRRDAEIERERGGS